MNIPPPIPPASKRSPWVGVGIGCGVLIGILIIAIVLLLIFMMRAGGRHVQVEKLVSDDAIAVIHLTDCREDTGVKGLLELAMNLQQDLYKETMREAELPAVLQGWSEFWMRFQSGQLDTRFIPEIVVSIMPDSTGTNITFSAAATLTGFPRFARYLMAFTIKQSAAGGVGAEYRKVSIMDMGEFLVAIPKGALFVAEEMSDVEKMVDGLRDESESTNLLATIDAEWKAKWDLYAMFQNRDGLLTDAFTALATENFEADAATNTVAEAGAETQEDGTTTLSQTDLLGAISAGTVVKGEVGINIVTGSEIHGELLLDCTTGKAARQMHDLVRGNIDRAIEGLGEEELMICVESKTDGTQVQIQIFVNQLDSWLKIKAKDMITELQSAPRSGVGMSP